MFSYRTMAIYRLTRPEDESGGSYKRGWNDTENVVSGHLETSAAEFAAMNDGEYGKVFQFFSDDLYSDVRIGDRLVEGSTKYEVRGVLRHTDAPGRKLEIILILHIDQ